MHAQNPTPKNLDLGINLNPQLQRWIEQKVLVVGATTLSLTVITMFSLGAVASVLVAGAYGLTLDTKNPDQTNQTKDNP